MKLTGKKEEKDEEQALLARFKQEESKKEFCKKKKVKNHQKHGDKPESSKSGGESSKNQGKKFDKRRYNALIVTSMNVMLLNAGSIKIERERTKSKKQMLLMKIHILMLIQSC